MGDGGGFARCDTCGEMLPRGCPGDVTKRDRCTFAVSHGAVGADNMATTMCSSARVELLAVLSENVFATNEIGDFILNYIGKYNLNCHLSPSWPKDQL